MSETRVGLAIANGATETGRFSPGAGALVADDGSGDAQHDVVFDVYAAYVKKDSPAPYFSLGRRRSSSLSALGALRLRAPTIHVRATARPRRSWSAALSRDQRRRAPPKRCSRPRRRRAPLRPLARAAGALLPSSFLLRPFLEKPPPKLSAAFAAHRQPPRTGRTRRWSAARRHQTSPPS